MPGFETCSVLKETAGTNLSGSVVRLIKTGASLSFFSVDAAFVPTLLSPHDNWFTCRAERLELDPCLVPCLSPKLFTKLGYEYTASYLESTKPEACPIEPGHGGVTTPQ